MKNTTLLKQEISEGKYGERFLELYSDSSVASNQVMRYIDAIESFEKLYGEDDVTIFSAPGRSEIGGNHTDHQQGEVLAASINLDAIGIIAKTDDNLVRIVSEGYEEIAIDSADLSKKAAEEGTTAALIRGVLAGVNNRGFKVGGFKGYVTSDVLIGAGLSSSAAFEVLVGYIISSLYNDGAIDPVTVAMIGQYAENEYFGKPCGLMDQSACSVGNMVHINFADPASPVVEKIDYDMQSAGYSLCITDTKGSHANLTHEYAAIPQEMKAVAGFFGKEVLLGITLKDLLDNSKAIRSKYGDRAFLRAIHLVRENERVRREVAALKSKDFNEFLKQIQSSGNSSYKYLQNVYTSSDVTHQNVSVALAISDVVLGDGCGVSRVHGGGFAGTIQAFVRDFAVNNYKQTMDSLFGEGSCKVLKIRKEGGTIVM